MTPQNGGPLDALLLPILITLVVGIVVTIAWLIWNVVRPKADQTVIDAVVSAPPQTTPPPALLSVRRTSSKEWQIDVQGETYPTLGSVPDPRTRAQVLEALRALAGFARSYLQQQRSADGSPVTPEADSVPAEAPSTQRSGIRSATSLPTERIPGVTVPVDQPARRSGPPGTLLPTIDLAHEIGEIIDEMQARAPTLQAHSVRLQNVPSQGVAFVVDGVVYHELAEIPFPEVQTLIREATQEWERR